MKCGVKQETGRLIVWTRDGEVGKGWRDEGKGEKLRKKKEGGLERVGDIQRDVRRVGILHIFRSPSVIFCAVFSLQPTSTVPSSSSRLSHFLSRCRT